MATIYETIKYNDCQRPKYTPYELSSLVKNKRQQENLDQFNFAKRYDIEIQSLIEIEEIKQSFSPNLYIACCKILNMSIVDIIEIEKDDLSCVSFRASTKSDNMQKTVDLANFLFNEIIMQKRINAN
jgi:transcriptional regulator with XRE-family HTH domain